MTSLASTCNIGISESKPTDSLLKQTILWKKDTSKGFLPSNQSIYDLYPNNGGIVVSTTSGMLSAPISRAKVVTEFLLFRGTDTQRTSFPSPTSVTITTQGNFLDINGVSTGVSFTYNADEDQIIATKKVYGVVKVTYTASFKRYTLTFTGSCPITDADLLNKPFFEDALLLGVLTIGNNTSVGSILATNPDSRCFGSSGFVAGTAPVPGSPIIEVPKFHFVTEKTELSSQLLGTTLDPVSIIKCYPDVGQGFKLLSNDPLQFFTTKPKIENAVKEELIFNNTSRITLKFPEAVIESAVSTTEKVADQFGFLVKPFINLPGNTVNIVTWESSGNPIFTGKQREVDNGEIVITDISKNEMAIQGVLLVTYMATYLEVTYHHKLVTQVNTGGKDETYAERDVIIARKSTIGSRNDMVGTFVINRWKIAEKEL